nr:glycosyltransferase [Candidatus Freyrarchaeum guaymaensis]
MGRNVGVAAAYNRAIPRMNSEFIAILNNDAEVDKNWLKNLISVISDDNNVAAVTCKIKFINDKRRINSAGGSCDIYGVGWNRGNGQLDNGQYNNPDEPFYSTGSAMLLKSLCGEKRENSTNDTSCTVKTWIGAGERDY